MPTHITLTTNAQCATSSTNATANRMWSTNAASHIRHYPDIDGPNRPMQKTAFPMRNLVVSRTAPTPTETVAVLQLYGGLAES